MLVNVSRLLPQAEWIYWCVAYVALRLHTVISCQYRNCGRGGRNCNVWYPELSSLFLHLAEEEHITHSAYQCLCLYSGRQRRRALGDEWQRCMIEISGVHDEGQSMLKFDSISWIFLFNSLLSGCLFFNKQKARSSQTLAPLQWVEAQYHSSHFIVPPESGDVCLVNFVDVSAVGLSTLLFKCRSVDFE